MSPFDSELPLSLLAHNNLENLRSDLTSKFTVEDQRLALELFVLIDHASRGERSPRLFQVEAAISIIRGKDTIVRAGTGSGKTLVMILVLLYCKEDAAVTIVPLKCLQMFHVRLFAPSLYSHLIVYRLMTLNSTEYPPLQLMRTHRWSPKYSR